MKKRTGLEPAAAAGAATGVGEVAGAPPPKRNDSGSLEAAATGATAAGPTEAAAGEETLGAGVGLKSDDSKSSAFIEHSAFKSR